MSLLLRWVRADLAPDAHWFCLQYRNQVPGMRLLLMQSPTLIHDSSDEGADDDDHQKMLDGWIDNGCFF